jgi:hypothetical protein
VTFMAVITAFKATNCSSFFGYTIKASIYKYNLFQVIHL